MPVYAYYCEACGLEMELEHGMSDEMENCPVCKAEKSLEKIPSMFMSKVFKEFVPPKPGTIVKNFIKESKEELEQAKSDLKGDYKQ